METSTDSDEEWVVQKIKEDKPIFVKKKIKKDKDGAPLERTSPVTKTPKSGDNGGK
jgi:hypothetical protein